MKRPAQLPADVNAFTGRTVELSALDGMASAHSAEVLPIVVVSGAPGVGKTALAVRWAHRRAHISPTDSCI